MLSRDGGGGWFVNIPADASADNVVRYFNLDSSGQSSAEGGEVPQLAHADDLALASDGKWIAAFVRFSPNTTTPAVRIQLYRASNFSFVSEKILEAADAGTQCAGTFPLAIRVMSDAQGNALLAYTQTVLSGADATGQCKRSTSINATAFGADGKWQPSTVVYEHNGLSIPIAVAPSACGSEWFAAVSADKPFLQRFDAAGGSKQTYNDVVRGVVSPLSMVVLPVACDAQQQRIVLSYYPFHFTQTNSTDVTSIFVDGPALTKEAGIQVATERLTGFRLSTHGGRIVAAGLTSKAAPLAFELNLKSARARSLAITPLESNTGSSLALQENPYLVGRVVDVGSLGGAFVIGMSKDYPNSTLNDLKVSGDPGNATSTTYLLNCWD